MARLEAAAILPHGDFAYDPFLVDDPKEHKAAKRIAKESRRVGKNFLDEYINPDVLFLVTPHGIALSHDFVIYLGKTASGYADIGTDLHRPNSTYRVGLPTISLDPDMALDLLQNLKHANVTGIKAYADDSQDTPLQWAEVIPLLFVNTTNVQRRHLIWSQPLRRFGAAEGTDLVNELLQLGRKLFTWMENRPERVAVLISADLSHTHRANGPYGYSATSQPFDNSIHSWATSPCRNAKALLQHATKLQPRALSCGYTGMVLLHGILCGQRHAANWDSVVFVNQNVTYYGMMAAFMTRVRKNGAESVSPGRTA
eukprot:scaffold1230_cov166-Amphora_coffeaeformis.AAC.10